MELFKKEKVLTAQGCDTGLYNYVPTQAVPIPDNATNGDIITSMYPDYRVEDNGGSIYLHYPNGGWILFDRDWWNSPYLCALERK